MGVSGMGKMLSLPWGCISWLEYWIVALCLQPIVIATDILTVQFEG